MRILPVFVALIGTVTKESAKKGHILYRSSKKACATLRHFAQSCGGPALCVIPSLESRQHIGQSNRVPPKSACNFAFESPFPKTSRLRSDCPSAMHLLIGSNALCQILKMFADFEEFQTVPSFYQHTDQKNPRG